MFFSRALRFARRLGQLSSAEFVLESLVKKKRFIYFEPLCIKSPGEGAAGGCEDPEACSRSQA